MAPAERPPQSHALIALVITGVLAALKVAVWIATGSLAVLSQALDSVLDILALGLLLVGLRIAARPADSSHHYGHGKAENLSVFAQTLLLGAVVVWVAAGAINSLLGEPHDVAAPWYSFALLGGSALIDVVRVRILIAAARASGSHALRAGALNLATDVGTAVVALITLVFVRAGVDRADSIGALIVAIAVSFAAYRLGKSSVDVLMDRAPEAPVEAIAEAASRTDGVAETRRVRVRGTGDQLFADVTVAAGRTASLERAHEIAEEVEREIATVAPGTDVVVHVEPVSETSGLVERVQAGASRTKGVHEVHNVLVHAFDEGGISKLHVTLHAKVGPGLSLEEAHRLADDVESQVMREMPHENVRVDAHIEPLRTTTPGSDITADREDLVREIRTFALEEPDVLNCHEVVLTSSGSEISVVAHVGGRGDLPLTRMHDASERIEKAIHAAYPEIGPVTIHFEPA